MKKVVAGLSLIGLMLLCGAIVMTLMTVIPDASCAAQKKAAESSAVVDINTADQKALEALPGVGKATAKAIIAGRPFKSVDDLKRVKGMSDKKINAIRNKVTVSGAAATAAPAEPPKKAKVEEKKTADKPAAVEPAKDKSAKTKSAKSSNKLAPGQTVNINTASQQELEALPGIGPKKAQDIIKGRPYDKPEDIMKVKGIKQGIYNKIKDNIVVK
jgi:competence protein ComEA